MDLSLNNCPQIRHSCGFYLELLQEWISKWILVKYFYFIFIHECYTRILNDSCIKDFIQERYNENMKNKNKVFLINV